MARWEPDSQGRLQQAALALYSERGFEQTTVAEIAERAGLTERTFCYYGGSRELGLVPVYNTELWPSGCLVRAATAVPIQSSRTDSDIHSSQQLLNSPRVKISSKSRSAESSGRIIIPVQHDSHSLNYRA